MHQIISDDFPFPIREKGKFFEYSHGVQNCPMSIDGFDNFSGMWTESGHTDNLLTWGLLLGLSISSLELYKANFIAVFTNCLGYPFSLNKNGPFLKEIFFLHAVPMSP